MSVAFIIVAGLVGWLTAAYFANRFVHASRDAHYARVTHAQRTEECGKIGAHLVVARRMLAEYEAREMDRAGMLSTWRQIQTLQDSQDLDGM